MLTLKTGFYLFMVGGIFLSSGFSSEEKDKYFKSHGIINIQPGNLKNNGPYFEKSILGIWGRMPGVNTGTTEVDDSQPAFPKEAGLSKIFLSKIET